MNMRYKEYYLFSSKLTASTFQAHPVSLNKPKEGKLSDQYKLIHGRYDGIDFPVRFNQISGKEKKDILDTGWASLYLISDKFKIVLEEGNVTGWKSFPIELIDKNGMFIRGYHGLSIIGRSGLVDYAKSEVIEKRITQNAPLIKFYRGLPVGIDKWDGEDIFLPNNYTGIIVTKRVFELICNNKISNVELTDILDVETPVFAVP